MICRRVMACQRAAKWGPTNRDFSGIGEFPQFSFDDGGGLRTSELEGCMAELQKTDATALMQFCPWQEELEHEENRRRRMRAAKGALPKS